MRLGHMSVDRRGRLGADVTCFGIEVESVNAERAVRAGKLDAAAPDDLDSVGFHFHFNFSYVRPDVALRSRAEFQFAAGR